MSTSDYGTWLTGWLLAEALRILGIHLSLNAFETVHFLIRKLAHLTEYAILALLLYGSLGGGRDFGWSWRRAGVCTLIAAVYSLTDEFHQWFVPGRGASLRDSALDTAGAILAMAGVYVFTRVSRGRASNSAASAARPAET
jgi:VanZ family protein